MFESSKYKDLDIETIEFEEIEVNESILRGESNFHWVDLNVDACVCGRSCKSQQRKIKAYVPTDSSYKDGQKLSLSQFEEVKNKYTWEVAT